MAAFNKQIIVRIGKAIGRIHPGIANELKFIRLFKRPINRLHPRTFAEKIILAMNSPMYRAYSVYADKYQVRGYVEQTIGAEYLIALLGVYDSPEEIPYPELPEGTFLNLNHGSGYNAVYHRADHDRISRQIAQWYHEDYSRTTLEQQYKDIPRKILAMENLAPAGQTLQEFNFFTFPGKVEFVQVMDHRGHRFEVGRSYEPLPFRLFSTVTQAAPEPPEFRRMVQLAEALAKPFPFVRVDLLLREGRIYFLELTFAPGAGIRRFYPMEYNYIFGDKLPW